MTNISSQKHTREEEPTNLPSGVIMETGLICQEEAHDPQANIPQGSSLM